MPDEESPLLLNSSGGHGHERRGSTLRQVLFDRHHTPGQDSDNRMVRWSANAFNVAKVTLLSSKCNSNSPERLTSGTELTLLCESRSREHPPGLRSYRSYCR